jgi:hypothetical protein
VLEQDHDVDVGGGVELAAPVATHGHQRGRRPGRHDDPLTPLGQAPWLLASLAMPALSLHFSLG